jgi:hypothetical protein
MLNIGRPDRTRPAFSKFKAARPLCFGAAALLTAHVDCAIAVTSCLYRTSFVSLSSCNVQLRVISEQLVEALPDEVCVACGTPRHLPAFLLLLISERHRVYCTNLKLAWGLA